ncbi:MAG: hypothetical protein AMS24_00235 [Chlamydiae bacterium SM23_39]|nr:MAG: hypothetical protein AMS24_00235 [Chlamydiae bacterium SM23_39]
MNIVNNLNDLPKEMLLAISEYLTIDKAFLLNKVSKYFRSIVNSEVFEKNQIKKLEIKIKNSKFSNLLNLLPSLKENDTKKMLILTYIMYKNFAEYNFKQHHLNISLRRGIIGVGDQGDATRRAAYQSIVENIADSFEENQTLKHAESIAKLIFKDDFGVEYSNTLSTYMYKLINNDKLEKAFNITIKKTYPNNFMATIFLCLIAEKHLQKNQKEKASEIYQKMLIKFNKLNEDEKANVKKEKSYLYLIKNLKNS